MKLDVEVLVPGHGDAVYGSAAIHAELEGILHYLSTLRSTICNQLKRGASENDILAIPPDEFVHRSYENRDALSKRHQACIQKLLTEVAGAS